MPGDYLATMGSAAPVASAPAGRGGAAPAALTDLYSGAVVSGGYTKPAKAAVKPAVSMPGDYLATMGSAAPVASAPAAAAAAPAALTDLYSGAVVSGSYTKPAKAAVNAGGVDAW